MSTQKTGSASLPERSDAVVIGGGAAGLAAARHLAAAGAGVLLLEAAGRLGGRIVTDDVDGFRLDRGFQVINTAYPALPRLVDLASLDLRYFDHAVLLGGDSAGGGPRLLADPRRHPSARALWQALDPRSAPVPAAALARLALLSARLGYARPASLLAEPEAAAASYLGRRLDERTITTLVEPFLTGVFGEQALTTSSHVTAMIWRSFVRGRIGVPAAGMARLPQALAAPLPAGCVRLSTPVGALGDRSGGTWPVHTEAGTIRARAVIVATDPATAARLVPGLTAPAQRILVTTYHAAAEAPARRPALLLDGTGRSGIANSITLTLAAPGYAPPGRHLIATTAPESAGLGEAALRRHLAALYGAPTGDWEHIATVRADPGLVAAPPPQGRLRQPVRFGDGLLVAGDHRDTPSLQGALVSGGRAARAALRELGLAPR